MGAKILQKIRIDKWKFIIPDCGNLVHFKKKVDMEQAKNAEFYEKFLYKNINASILHLADIFLSPFYFFFIRPEFYLTIGLTGFLLVLILNIMPVMLQRYLRPKLLRIYDRLKIKENTPAEAQ